MAARPKADLLRRVALDDLGFYALAETTMLLHQSLHLGECIASVDFPVDRVERHPAAAASLEHAQ